MMKVVMGLTYGSRISLWNYANVIKGETVQRCILSPPRVDEMRSLLC